MAQQASAGAQLRPHHRITRGCFGKRKRHALCLYKTMPSGNVEVPIPIHAHVHAKAGVGANHPTLGSKHTLHREQQQLAAAAMVEHDNVHQALVYVTI